MLRNSSTKRPQRPEAEHHAEHQSHRAEVQAQAPTRRTGRSRAGASLVGRPATTLAPSASFGAATGGSYCTLGSTAPLVPIPVTPPLHSPTLCTVYPYRIRYSTGRNVHLLKSSFATLLEFNSRSTQLRLHSTLHTSHLSPSWLRHCRFNTRGSIPILVLVGRCMHTQTHSKSHSGERHAFDAECAVQRTASHVPAEAVSSDASASKDELVFHLWRGAWLEDHSIL